MGQGVNSQKNTYCENENALASKGARYGAMSGILLFVINIIFIGPITSTEHVAPLQLHLIHTLLFESFIFKTWNGQFVKRETCV